MLFCSPHPKFLLWATDKHVVFFFFLFSQTSTAPPRRVQGSPELVPTTPGTSSLANSSMDGLVGTGSPFQSGRQPITPPPTPPRRHFYPRNLSHDYPPTPTPPSPSPSVSSSALSSTSRIHQTEWIYRRPKSSSPANNAFMSRHRSPSTSASCTPQLSRSPSISSRTHRDSATTNRSSKHRQHAAAIPRPSSPVLISSTSQLVDAPGLEPASRSPSISSNATGLRSAANASVSSLQLQSSIRVSPLKNRTCGPSYSPVPNFSGSGAGPPGIQRCPSNTSITTNNSTSTAIWSAIRAKSTSTPERNRILKSIPSQSQIAMDSSVKPMFAVPSPSSLPLSSRDLIPPRLPPKDRHTFSGGPLLSPSLSQRDKDRHTHRRDKFASAPPVPVPIVGAASTRSSPSSIRPGANSPSSVSPPNNVTGLSASTSPSSPSGASHSTIKMSPNGRSRSPRDRTTSLTSQCSITTATTTHTAATTGTTSSSSSSRLHPYTPTTPSPIPVPMAVSGICNFRSSSNSSTSTPPSYLHGLGGGEKKQFHQHRHQRQASTSSTISLNSGSTAAAVAARSQAYAQLTGVSAKRRRPSTSPGSDTSLHSHPYSRQIRPNLGGSNATGYGSGLGGGNNGSASTLMPLSLSSSAPYPLTLPPPPTPSHSSSLSSSYYGNSYASRSPRTPLTPHAPHHPLPKAKSILTRTSSMSTKNSGCGGTVKSVKFVEIPEIHYRSGFSEEDGNEYIYGYGRGSDTPSYDNEEDGDDEDLAVGAKGEGQEGMVLRDCMGIDVETIDMDIDTYLGNGLPEEKETKLTFKRKQGLGWNFLSRGRKQERDADKDKETRRCDDEKEPVLEQKKEKSSSGLGLKRLMGLTSRKAPPPPLTLSISSPLPIGLRSPSTSAKEDVNTSLASKKRSTSPVSPSRKPISGPYVLGSHLPSRSPPTHLPLPSPSSSLLHHPTIPTCSVPASSSNASLNGLNGSLSGRHHNLSSASISYGNTTHRAKYMHSSHRRNPSLTTATGLGMSTERPVGPNIAGTRPKGIIGADVLSLNAVPIPLKSAPSYESFRSAKSYGGRSIRSEVGSVKSSKSAGAGSMRSFRTWMSKVSANVGGSNAGFPVAVAE